MRRLYANGIVTVKSIILSVISCCIMDITTSNGFINRFHYLHPEGVVAIQFEQLDGGVYGLKQTF